MKTIRISFLTLVSVTFMSNCISVTQKEPYPRTSTTTTTEQTTLNRPSASTVQTQTTRSP